MTASSASVGPLSHGHFAYVGNRAADMLEADAQPRQVTCQIYGHVVGACVECNTHIEAQQVAVPVPLTDGEIDAVTIAQWGEMHGQPLAAHRAFARAIEARLGITQQGDAPCNVYGSYSLG